MEQKILEEILIFLVYASATLFLGGSALLFLRGKNNRARRMMAYTMLIYALFYICRMVFLNDHPDFNDSFFSVLLDPELMTIGNIFVISSMFFPIEVILPGWLTVKRSFLMFLPQLLLSVVYYSVLAITGEEVEYFRTYAELYASFGHFNVWFRIFFLLSTCTYIFCLLKFVARYEDRYRKWRDDNYADMDKMDISWMNKFFLGIYFIALFYMLILLVNNIYVILLQTVVFALIYTYFLYKALFYESPYPEKFFEFSVDQNKAEENMFGESAENIENDESFETQLPSYVDKLKNWMEKEKPYLYKDFKLTDVTRVLPLNRSYISRVINVGFGKNFSELVRFYRISYAKNILENNIDIYIHNVGYLSGFSSDSSFIRSFVAETGMTPTQYRTKIKQKENFNKKNIK